MRTVLVTSRSFSTGTLDLRGRLRDAGLQVRTAAPTHDPEALAPLLAQAVAWIAGVGPVTADHLAAAPRLQVLARYGVGYDAVDLTAADRAGVVVTHTPGANSQAVAEHTLALLLALLRGVPAAQARLRAGDWSTSRGRQLHGATVGVVGFGRIGRATARGLRGLGCDVLVHDPFVTAAEVGAQGCTPVPLATVRERCAVVALHSPGGDTLVDEAWTRSCAPGQMVVNTARADLVQEAAVARALRTGALAGYAADTLATESLADAQVSPLLAPDLADRVVLTPHLGAQTVEAVDLMGSMATDDVLAVLAGLPPAHPVPTTRSLSS